MNQTKDAAPEQNPKKDLLSVRIRCAQNIRLLRQNARLSQTEFGRLLGFEQATVSRIEQGKQTLSAEELYAIAQFFKVRTDDLLSSELAAVTATVHATT